MDAVETIHDKLLATKHKCQELHKAVDAFSRLGESELFIDDAPYSLSLLYLCRLVDRYVDAFHALTNLSPKLSPESYDISFYLTCKTAFDNFVSAAYRLHDLLASIDEHAKQGSFKLVSGETLERLAPYDLQNRFGWKLSLENYCQGIEKVEWIADKQAQVTSDVIHFLLREAQRDIHFLEGPPLKDYAIKQFKFYACLEMENSPLKLHNMAIKFKGNRLVKLAKTHWANLFDLDEQLMDKIIDGVPVGAEEYSRLYDENEWQELVRNREILRLLRETSDPEELYDWEMLFRGCQTFYDSIDETNVKFLFSRIHRANLIKCKLYDELKAKYETFLYGHAVSSKLIHPTPVQTEQAYQNEQEEQDEQEELPEPVKENGISGYLHPLIDEEFLAGCIKEYTDGPTRDPNFNKNCLWISIYTVLCQRHPLLGNKPIFSRKSRAKFAHWVTTRIQPSMYPCYKHSLDTVPPYFRTPKNYPWSLSAYQKAKGQKDATFESYAKVADYFQRNVFNNLKPFLK